MMKLGILACLFLVSCSQSDSIEKVESKESKTSEIKKPVVHSYSYKVLFEENKGWGYQIFNGSTLLINQMHIPSIQGIKGFETQQKAETTAEFILKEIENGVFPPTITKEILDSLGVL